MTGVSVDVEVLKELLNAAARSAMLERGTEHECYVLGQLEATANMAYALIAGSGHVELELLCQQLSLDALERHSYLANKLVASIPVVREFQLASPV